MIKNYINGDFLTPSSGLYLNSFEPATGEIYLQVPNSDKADVEKAVDAATAAFPGWANLSITKRSNYLEKISEALEIHQDALARAESIDNGKPLELAKTIDIPRAIANFKYFSQAITQFSSEAHSMSPDVVNYTLRQPLGPVACISPWNLPLYLFTWKIAPALAAGNTVVAKPSEITPMTAFLLSKICADVGLPTGVLNIVHGKGPVTGAAMVSHPDIKAISFTGGTQTGAIIASKAAPQFKKLSLELGGKNPNIIFADCDYEKMLTTTLRSSFANQGQICLCGSRIYVERSIYSKFKQDFIQRTKNLMVGDPMHESTDLGAIVSKEHFDKILHYIELAKTEGGTILEGGVSVHVEGRCENGWFLRPTIIEGLDADSRVNCEEIFGPVVTITPFDSIEEVVALANGTSYGLSCTIWSNDINKAHLLARDIEAGIIWINCWLVRDLRTPFGGMKNSGLGREGGFEALKFFTEAKNVCIKLNP